VRIGRTKVTKRTRLLDVGAKRFSDSLMDQRREVISSCDYRINSWIQSAVPFVPNEIHQLAAKPYEVPHPDFVSISPKGRYVIIIDAKERPHHLNALLIDRASPLNGQRRRRFRKRS